MHVRCDNRHKTGAEGFFGGQLMLFECMSVCIFSLAHESEMRGNLVYLLIVKYESILFQFSHCILEWMALSCNLGGIFWTFLEWSVDNIIYMDYIVNQSSFIYWSLACRLSSLWLNNRLCINLYLAVVLGIPWQKLKYLYRLFLITCCSVRSFCLCVEYNLWGEALSFFAWL